RHLPELRRLCREHRLSRLWLFGSALRADFGPDSDVDLLYEMEAGLDPEQTGTLFWSLLRSLETLLGRPVDLLRRSSLQNPYLLAEIEETEVLIYDAAGEALPV
ncbi:MAG: nucleotidyltransferase domain-containing protein, partial [Bacteroidia bacterium]|nr:nucleotidyltransferase domain-containing protein [Bacteroidia bacterium]